MDPGVAAARHGGISHALRTFVRGVRGDVRALVAGRAKYFGERLRPRDVPGLLVSKVGLQILVVARTEALLHDAGLPRAAGLAGATLRHLYGAEVSPRAILEPGIAVIHGTGLVVGDGVRVGPGAILLHDVTLDRDPDGEAGAPTLEADVHVGPGATILGPVVIGAGTKIMAGAVVTRSVPPGSLVRPAPAPERSRPAAR